MFLPQGVKQNVTELEKKGKSYLQLRKIRQFDPDFETRAFADTAHDIYVSAHQLLEESVPRVTVSAAFQLVGAARYLKSRCDTYRDTLVTIRYVSRYFIDA